MPGSSTPTQQLVDLLHLGRPHVIGAWVLGDVVIDPGPSSGLGALLPHLEIHPPRVLALTHIHLDHAGATGSLVGRFPDVEVWVHERGARHLAEPARLIDSATRLYGSDMDRMWGEVLPVAPERMRVLRGGESLGPFRVAYTPGHASHHVSYLHEPSGRAFTGDVAGVRIDDGPSLPPTPPPDIDTEAWRSSLERIARWHPRSLALTHFGAFEDVGRQLGEVRAQLDRLERMAERLEEDAFIASLRELVSDAASPATAAAYEQAMPPHQSFQGLARHLARARA